MAAAALLTNEAVLVIGEPTVAQRRAHELRMHGHASWIVATEPELRWLQDVARLRAGIAIVELGADRAQRDRCLGIVSSLAAIAKLPCVVVGATSSELAHFAAVVATLPADTSTDQILAVIRGVRAP